MILFEQYILRKIYVKITKLLKLEINVKLY